MNLKRIIKVIIVTLSSVIAVLVFGFLLLSFAVRCYATWGAKPFEKLVREAESVIADAGGYAVLAEEVSWVLAYDGSAYGYLFENALSANAPAIYKVKENLYNAWLWVVHTPCPVQKTTKAEGEWWREIEMPKCVKIRFGTHSSYAWIYMFAPDNTLKELPEGVIHLGESIYISRGNL